jgi:hypothetical protein
MKTILFVISVLLSGSLSVQAEQQCTIQAVKGSPGALVATPGKADTMLRRIREGKTAEATECCMACLPKVGTKVVITEAGLASHSIRVVEGEFKGCEGEVDRKWVGECQ